METTAPIEVRKKGSQVPQQPATPAELLTLAVSKDLDIDKLAKLMELQDRYNKEQSRKAFFSALADFQSECPEIRKTKGGADLGHNGKPSYFYAPLGDIDRQIKGPLKRCGLTKRWEFAVTEKNEIICTFIATHIDGHSESTTLTGPPDDSGKKNPLQANNSSVSYLMRYTLIAGLGITTADQDIDGRMPDLDIDKLHQQYMELYGKICEIDPEFLSKGDPDNWAKGVQRTPEIYVKAIGRARQLLAKLTLKND